MDRIDPGALAVAGHRGVNRHGQVDRHGRASAATLAGCSRSSARPANKTGPCPDAERAEIRRLSEGGSPAAPQAGGRPTSLMQDPAEVEYRQARLQHLCALIARTRWPLCPINGAIVYVPIEDCEKEEVAQQLGLIARQDLRTAEDSLKLHFPVFALLGGLETLPGRTEFLAKFGADRRTQRLGKGFPLAPDLAPDAAADEAEKVHCGCSTACSRSGCSSCSQSNAAAEGPAAATRGRMPSCFTFLDAVRQRGSAAARLVGRLATSGSKANQPVSAACYLTANAPQVGPGPLFADEFFKKVLATQGFVAWTDAAFADDASYRRLTKAGYLFIVVIVFVVLALAAFVIYDWSKQGR